MSTPLSTTNDTPKRSDLMHDARNRIGSLNLTLHILKKKSSPDMHQIIDDAQAQIRDLTALLGDLEKPSC